MDQDLAGIGAWAIDDVGQGPSSEKRKKTGDKSGPGEGTVKGHGPKHSAHKKNN